MIRYVIIVFFAIYISILGQEILFFREDINFNLDHNNLQVEGFYWFTNPTNIKSEKTIFFPFGDTTDIEIVDSVQVESMSMNKPMKIIKKSKYGFSFLIRVAAYDTVVCRIFYNQKISCDSAKYILSSTQTWDKPLEIAEYKLITHKLFKVKKISITPDKIYAFEDKKIYYWKRYNFKPNYDLMFYF